DVVAVTKELLASQKIAAIMGRKRPKGRDFFDLRWLLDRGVPDFGYLNDRFSISTDTELRSMVNERIKQFDFNYLAEDVRSFLFERADIEGVRNFPAYWQKVLLT
ncbi:MAG: nucleotidyl transferase AbiEii/AbiGii toxin family protein, partial [Bacteroidota bacterium]